METAGLACRWAAVVRGRQDSPDVDSEALCTVYADIHPVGHGTLLTQFLARHHWGVCAQPYMLRRGKRARADGVLRRVPAARLV